MYIAQSRHYGNHANIQLNQNEYRPSAEMYGYIRSPCKTCSHQKEDKNVCRLRKDCPINILTLRPPTDRESPTSKKQWHECAFPGCKNKTTREYCSNGCAQTVYYRKKKYPDNPELWHVPRDNPGGKQTLKSKYKRGKK